jgi:16S rRNA (cytosine1402-N4)-methyltransferase
MITQTVKAVAHQPVLVDKVIEYLKIEDNDIIIDGTLGLGGHARHILMELGQTGKLIGFDLDNRNLQEARRNLRRFQGKVYYVNDSYEKISHYIKVLKLTGYDKVLLDLGVSSPHFDLPESGFSYSKKGPLDMRYSKENKVTASVIVNKLSEEKIAELLKNFGEVPSSKKVAHVICEARKKKPFVYTTDLTEVLRPTIPVREFDRRMACIFQALRIAVNDELNVLYRGLRNLFEHLNKGGRMVVISYHSLEDRIVKRFFQECLKPPVSFEQSRRRAHGDPLVKILNKKVIRPLKDEVEENPRSRSAKMRSVVKK